MSSRKQPQRRRGGREAHADPESVADALLNPEGLEAHLSTVLGADKPDVNDTCNGKVIAQHGDPSRKQAVDHALSIYAAGGDAQVQESLKAEIAVTKKLESELAQTTKKVETARRQQKALLTEHEKNVALRDGLHKECSRLIEERERLEKIAVDKAAADESRLTEVRKKFEHDVEGILAKVREQAQQKQQTLQENEGLQREFNELKARFDQMMERKMQEWTERESATQKLVADLSEQIAAHEALRSECERLEIEARQAVDGAEMYRDQSRKYSARLGEFEAALAKSVEVVQLLAQQKVQFEQRFAEIDSAKNAVIAARKEAESETARVRGHIRDLRKNMIQLERRRAAAEKRSRAVQERFRLAMHALKETPVNTPNEGMGSQQQ